MSRVNVGKHLIISTEVHTALKSECTKAGVRMTDVADAVLKDFLHQLDYPVYVEPASAKANKDAYLKELATRRGCLKQEEVPTSEPAAVQGGDAPVAPKDEAPADGTSAPQ